MNSRMKKFISYYKPYKGLLLADLFCALIVAAISLALPLLIRHITMLLDNKVPNVLEQIYITGGTMVVLVALLTACNMFITYKGHMMGAMMEGDMRRELFDHLQKLSFRFYDEHKTGQLMTRSTTDIFWLTELYHHGPEDILITLVTIIGSFIILGQIDMELTIIIFMFLPFMAAYFIYFSKKMNKAERRSKDRIEDINAQLEDSLSGIRVVKSFTNEHVERKKFGTANKRFVQSRGVGYWSMAYFHEGLYGFTHLISIAVIIFGAIGISGNALTLPDLLTFFLVVGILIAPIQKIINFMELYQVGITGFERFMEILEVEPDIVDAPHAKELKHADGQITFQNVGFKYNEGHEHIFHNVSLNIRAGEYVALVGPSGAGKTTLCSLIPRFYEVNDGQILLDGTNIKDITMQSLRQNIGIVQQDVYLFAGTVIDNIRYGKMDATDEEIIAAAKMANAHDFIMSLPDGYLTDIGQRGVKLSGGQKQRLSIARVFLKNPSILILDEATSALDNESERAIKESLEKLTNNRTTIVIAHRLSTVRNAERIIVLTDNGIEEQGTHEELLKQGGTYANLYQMQDTVTTFGYSKYKPREPNGTCATAMR
ncbi:ABC transporter ATP-binding protein/permease [Paenibacillus sp. N1-5-1-14]|uniref:ABC transporter ATP-binding protein n=1 Tax=Paenibacillus radicibacter TaxID=2972488 RepID=UPI00215992C9|nr:ABC transporter ATP-binding protein [Paenibacillus radicibacter]MCR8643805.1 ABC transporter ATP-binding protein/permease [Paenibacillus radicibacter]